MQNSGIADLSSANAAVVKRSTLVIVVVVTVAAAALAGGYTLYRQLSPTERALGDLRGTPLVGAALADHPEVEDRLRQAIREEQRNPTTSGPSRPLQVVGELRRDVIAPVLRNADDASVVAAMAARVVLVHYLQKADPQICREFSMGGISHPEKLDPEAQRLFRDVLVAMEAAYRSGRNGKPQPMPTSHQIGEMMREAGFTKADFDRLNNFATLSDDVSCEMELKVDDVPPHLPPEKRGPFSRFVVAR
jgi:hypothetical protein